MYLLLNIIQIILIILSLHLTYRYCKNEIIDIWLWTWCSDLKSFPQSLVAASFLQPTVPQFITFSLSIWIFETIIAD